MSIVVSPIVVILGGAKGVWVATGVQLSVGMHSVIVRILGHLGEPIPALPLRSDADRGPDARCRLNNDSH